MNKYILEFETPLKEIEDKIESLRNTAINTGVDVSDGIIALQEELNQQKHSIYSNLSRWQRVQIARHPEKASFNRFYQCYIRTSFLKSMVIENMQMINLLYAALEEIF